MSRTLLIIVLILTIGEVWSQSSGETKALKDISKQRWAKCELRVAKILSRDDRSVGGYYVRALYFFSPANPAFNIDSAYASVNQSLFYFEQLDLRQRERLARLPLDSSLLRSLRARIDSAAFERAKTADTAESYSYFLEHFPTAVNYEDAILLLHEAAYRKAVEANTYQAFDNFLKKYPRSTRTVEAKENYDRLLFETKTKDKRLSTYRNYLSENPRSPYRRLVEQQLFEISTASGDPESYRQFIHDFPESSIRKRAEDILYYLVRDVEGKAMTETMMSDSLRHIHELNRGYLVPFYSSGRFGFMDKHGKEIIPAIGEKIDQQYLCGNIAEDVLVLDGKILARNGAIIFEGDVEEIDDLGYGFLAVRTRDGKQIVLHKSGFPVAADREVEDALLPGGRFIAIRISGNWSLYSLTGKLLLEPSWDEIKYINQVLSLERDDRFYLITCRQAGLIADQQHPDFSESYDEVKRWSNTDLLWVKRGDGEGILDSSLKNWLPVENHTLRACKPGIEARSTAGVKFYSYQGDESELFQDIKVTRHWMSTKLDNRWSLFDSSEKKAISPAFDSVSFVGIFAAGFRNDSVKVYFNRKSFLNLKNASLRFIAGKDSSFYLIAVEGNRQSVYNAQGKKLFESAYDNIQLADKGVFIVTKREKKGLVSENGKLILPVAYDAIGDGDGKYIPLLRSMKFGLYDLQNKREIRPGYDKNLKRLDDKHIIAFKNGNYGIIDIRNKSIVPFEYEDIRYWNDSAVFVRKNSVWQLLDLENKKVILDNIKEFRTVQDTEREKIVIVNQNGNFGVISSVRGSILALTYTDIVNIGSAEDPFYFTEKHVEEAQIFVAIYYDENGKLVRRQAFEPEEYEEIYCSDN